jgi:hypothetical protein
MSVTSPIDMQIAFRILPGRCGHWQSVWRQVRDLALRQPSCHGFQLLRSAHGTRCAAVSRWDSAAAFAAFVRVSGLLWIDRGAGYGDGSARFTVREILTEPALAVPTGGRLTRKIGSRTDMQARSEKLC